MLSARRVDAAQKPALEVVEAAQATPGSPESSAPKRSNYGRYPGILLFLAAGAIIWHGISTRSASLLLAGGALAAASFLLIGPPVLPGLGQLTKLLVPEYGVGPAALAAGYLAPLTGLAIDLQGLALAAGVVVTWLFWKSSPSVSLFGAAGAIAGQLAAVSFSFVPASAGTLAVVAVATTAAAVRSRRLEGEVAHILENLAAKNARATAASEASKEGSETALSVLGVANELAGANDPSAIPDQIARATSSQLRAAGTVLLLWDDALETFRIGAVHGRDLPGTSDLRQVEVRPDAIPTLRSHERGEVVEVNPSAVREPMLMSLLRRWKAGKMLGVRLQRGDQLIGLLFVARAEGQAGFSGRDHTVFGGIAVHAASALDHADLVADLQTANQLKEEFMATMSHELRTPLNVIIGYTDLQLEGAFGDLGEDHQDTLKTVREQALQLLELIQATLDMSRLERGLVTVDLQDVSVSQFIEQLRVQIPASWRKPTVELNWRLEPGLPPIRTDPSKLQILLRNLIHNGLKFTHHGMVSVSVAAQLAKQQLTFVVQDSGVGIKSEHLSEIFEMFRQAPNGDATPGGVGLGLYIVKRLAAVLGAEIEVSSAPGRGATFRIHVPLGGPLATRG